VLNFRPSDVQDVAILQLTDGSVALDDHAPLAHGFSMDDRVELGTERIGPENSNDERCFGAAKGLRRPFDELGEVEEEHGLHTVFRQRLGRDDPGAE
jgi:hypothetical protein